VQKYLNFDKNYLIKVSIIQIVDASMGKNSALLIGVNYPGMPTLTTVYT